MKLSSFPLKIAIFSSTQFGHECLKKAILLSEYNQLVGILTTPKTIDVGGKKTSMTISSHAQFEDFQKTTGCDIVTISNKPSAGDYLNVLSRWQADIVIVLGWYYLIPKDILAHPALGTIGIHASMLPKYRGMSPVSWALINGENETGVSLFYLDDSVDCGDLIAQHSIPIDDDDDCATLYEKVTSESINILTRYLPLLAKGEAPRQKQNAHNNKIFPRRSPEDGLIDWRWAAGRISNFIRAQTHPYPGAFTMIENRKLYIWRGITHSNADTIASPGTMSIEDENLLVQTGSGQMCLDRIQWEDDYERDAGELAHEIVGAANSSLVKESTIENLGVSP